MQIFLTLYALRRYIDYVCHSNHLRSFVHLNEHSLMKGIKYQLYIIFCYSSIVLHTYQCHFFVHLMKINMHHSTQLCRANNQIYNLGIDLPLF